MRNYALRLLKVTKPSLNVYEERIVRLLMIAYRPLTTQQIAKHTGISYNTVVKHLKNLKKRGLVDSEEWSNKIYWVKSF